VIRDFHKLPPRKHNTISSLPKAFFSFLISNSTKRTFHSPWNAYSYHSPHRSRRLLCRLPLMLGRLRLDSIAKLYIEYIFRWIFLVTVQQGSSHGSTGAGKMSNILAIMEICMKETGILELRNNYAARCTSYYQSLLDPMNILAKVLALCSIVG
jgi:hypothetical protein